MIAVFGRQQFQIFAVESDAVKMTEIRIAALFAAVRFELDDAVLRVEL